MSSPDFSSTRFRPGRRAFLAALALAAAGCGDDRAGPRPGEALPDLRLTGLDGSYLEIRSLRGQVLVLNAWATWCLPCRREMPALQRLSDAMQGRGGMVAGLPVDRDQNLVREFLLAHGITFPQYVDPRRMASDHKLSLLWTIFGILVVIMLALDLGVFHRKAKEIGVREALLWSAIWVAVAIFFNLFLFIAWEKKRQRNLQLDI